MTELDDPFALPDRSKVRDRDAILSRGRYMLPNRDGTKHPRGFMRVSNLVSAYSDQYGLRLWELGEVLQGTAMLPDLYAALQAAQLHKMDRAARNEYVERFIEQAKDVSGGNHGSKHGMQRHAAVESHHAGLPVGMHGPATRKDLSLYDAALQRHGLVAMPSMQERRVLVEALEVVGTLDNILNDMIGDLKTQRRFWTWLEIGAQLACYAHGDAMWDAESGTWVDMPPVRQDVALVLWMPRLEPTPQDPNPEPRVDVYEVDIAQGWKTAQRAYEVVKDRAQAKSVNVRRAWLRPAPPATETERWAARFAACESLAEGRKLVAAARAAGVWDETLAQSARLAADRLAIPA